MSLKEQAILYSDFTDTLSLFVLAFFLLLFMGGMFYYTGRDKRGVVASFIMFFVVLSTIIFVGWGVYKRTAFPDIWWMEKNLSIKISCE